MKILMLIPTLVAAGTVYGQGGAAYTALGKNLANSGSVFCLANQPAVALSAKSLAGFYGSNRFVNSDLVNGGMAAAFRLGHFSTGIHAGYAGTENLNRRLLEIGASQQINARISAGFSAGLAQVFQAQSYGAVNKLTGKFGLAVKINSKLDAGAVVVSPWQASGQWIGSGPGLHFSLGYAPQAHTKIWLQSRQQTGEDANIGMAFQHQKGAFGIMGSVQTGKEPVSMGFEWKRANLSLVFAGSWHQYLGLTPSFSLLWETGSKP